jgi:hypothetical protein
MLRANSFSAVTFVGALLCSLALTVLAQTTGAPHVPTVGEANPPRPDTDTFSAQLVIDDDSAESVFGFASAGARQFLWFNRFDNPGPFTLEEIWVLFPTGTEVTLNAAVQLVVYLDPDGDPTNGANLLATYDETVQAVDGDTFSVYPLATPLEIDAAGDVLIGVVNRYFTTGSPPPSFPAAYDSPLSLDRSYFALWSGDAPDPPDLATASYLELLSGATTGNFMIRGFGTLRQPMLPQVPVLNGIGLALLVTVLGLCAVILLRRRLLQ